MLISGCGSGGNGGGGGGGGTTSNPTPAITSLSPSSAAVGAAAQTLTITGTNFLSTSTVTYNNAAQAATYVSAMELTIQLSDSDQATAGSYAVVVTNPAPGGGASNSVNFLVAVSSPVPTITSLSPSSAVVGAAAQTLTITGTNFLSTSTVTYNSTAHSATYISATQLTIQLSASDQATAGSYPVVVSNPAPGGGASNAVNFVVATSNLVPAITSLSPSSAAVGAAAQTLTITGTNFLSTSTVTYNSTAHAATYVSATQLTIQLSSGDQATAGSYPVVVTNPAPGGGASNAVDFVVSSGSGVQINSLSATTISPLTPLTITGTGFDPTNAAISVLLVSESGNPSIAVPVFAATSTSVEIMVPPFPVSGTPGGQTTFGGDIEDLQVIQVDGSTLSTSNVYTGLIVSALPALPSGAKAGDLTVYYLQAALNVSATLQADAIANGWTALGADLVQNDANVDALITDITFVQNNPGQSAALTTGNGVTVQLDQNALTSSDQMIQAYVTQIAAQVPSLFAPGMHRNARGALLSRTQATPGQSTACPVLTSDPSDDQILCSIQQTEQTKAAKGGQLLQIFGTLYYGAGIEILGGYASAAATAALWSEEAITAMELAWSGAGSYVAAAGTSSAPPSPCDVIAGAGAKVLDDAASGGVGIFSTALSYLQLERDVAAIQNPSASSTPCPGPLLTGSSTNAPGGTDPIIDYQTTNGTTTETLIAAPFTQQSEPASDATIPPAQVQTYTLSTGVTSGDGAIESFPDGILCGSCANASASFPAGVSVSLTATPAAGESLISWSGACSGVGPCTVTMNSNQTVTATFGPGQTYSANFNAPFNGTFPDPIGDSYAASASGTIIISVTGNSNGAISGSASVPAYIGITVASCPAGDCETLPFSDTAAGPVSGNATSFTNTFTSSDGGFTVTFTGTLNSDGTITGSATFSANFVGSSDGSSIPTTLSGSIPSITLTQQ